VLQREPNSLFKKYADLGSVSTDAGIGHVTKRLFIVIIESTISLITEDTYKEASGNSLSLICHPFLVPVKKNHSIGFKFDGRQILRFMKFPHLIILCLVFLLFVSDPAVAQDHVVKNVPDDGIPETIVAIRHGEKPVGGLGNLNCRGLNRALALPQVLLSKYGKPSFIFAPNPAERFDGGNFNYICPLVTIEPTAIRCELPVNTEFGYTQVDELAIELRKAVYQHALIFIAWEHGELDKFAKLLVGLYGGDPSQVPFWREKDYDTIFVFTIRHQDGRDTIAFSIDHEGLDNLSDSCS
jgi:hypothetical protein